MLGEGQGPMEVQAEDCQILFQHTQPGGPGPSPRAPPGGRRFSQESLPNVRTRGHTSNVPKEAQPSFPYCAGDCRLASALVDLHVRYKVGPGDTADSPQALGAKGIMSLLLLPSERPRLGAIKKDWHDVRSEYSDLGRECNTCVPDVVA